MKNLIPILAGVTLPVFFTESTQVQNNPSSVLATSILNDSRLDTIPCRALQLLTGLSAGTSYGEIGGRDFKETDQESSLKQAIKKYVIVIGDKDVFFLSLSDKTILQRMEGALEYLPKERCCEKYGRKKDMLYTGGSAGEVLTGFHTKAAIAGINKQMHQAASKEKYATIGITVYPPYPAKEFPDMHPCVYQHAGDWAWFGGRMIQALIKNGFIQEAVDELKPMTDHVIAHNGFYEWYDVQTGKPEGSGNSEGRQAYCSMQSPF
jgi:hypothetical protein